MKFLILFLISSQCLAHFDLKSSLVVRSYPGLGGSFALESGYNISLYGEKSNQIYYGLLRPSLIHFESFVVRDTQYKLSFYPLKILEITVGKQNYISQYEKFSYYDCDNIRCRGEMSKDYTRGQMAIGLGRFFLTASYTYYLNTYSFDKEDPYKEVAEYDYGLFVQAKNEKQIRRNYITGINFESHRLGLIYQNDEFIESKKDATMRIIFFEKTFGELKLTNGFGDFESTDQKKAFIYILKLSFIFKSSNNII